MPESHSDIELEIRLNPGVLGYYTHFEVTEIFVIRDDDRVPRNVFSILVAEEQIGVPVASPRYLGGRIRLKSIEGMMFGIKRSIQPVSLLVQAVQQYRNSGVWQISDQPITVGNLMPLPPQFVPADSTESAPLNKILKNNFWSGSHVLEMMDVSKSSHAVFFERPDRLQELSAIVSKLIPIQLAGFSDRLGNIIVQIPVTILISSFSRRPGGENVLLNVRWHPKATPRNLIATCEKVFDNVVTGYAISPIEAEEVDLFVGGGLGMQRGLIWDGASKLILAATEPTAFINQINMQMHLADPEPRTFMVVDIDGTTKEVRVGLSDISVNSVQAPSADHGEEWTRRRVYRDEADRLNSQRRFVQYRPESGHQQNSHEIAIADLVLLISKHGRAGAWLWDPYLSADDLLRTLFRCPFKNVPLRALTAAYERPIAARAKPTLQSIFQQSREWLQQRTRRASSEPRFAERQREKLVSCQSNYRGLNLEYRMKSGQKGWSFHDRFLIFPNTDNGPLAWSLGSSVNSLGRQHHILQHVDNARLVADAFEELWDELSQPEHLIWKVP